MARNEAKVACERCLSCGRGPLVSGTVPGKLRHGGRGLCEKCHSGHTRKGTLDDFGKSVRTQEEFLADYLPLALQGLTNRGIAERMGMNVQSMRRAAARARRSARLRKEEG